MIFNDSTHEEKYLESFGIKEGDKVKVLTECESNGKKGYVVQMKLGFGSPLYYVMFYDESGHFLKNKFYRDNLELLEV